MSRTKGSGWGGGAMFYQKCPECGRKKVLYDTRPGSNFKCTWCKHWFDSATLLRIKYKSQYQPPTKNRFYGSGNNEIINAVSE